jgi:hypothetical protein
VLRHTSPKLDWVTERSLVIHRVVRDSTNHRCNRPLGPVKFLLVCNARRTGAGKDNFAGLS